MKRKSVGVLLSALVFPGVGQYYLGRRTRALLFLVPAVVAAILYVNFALDEATTMTDQLLSGAADAVQRDPGRDRVRGVLRGKYRGSVDRATAIIKAGIG